MIGMPNYYNKRAKLSIKQALNINFTVTYMNIFAVSVSEWLTRIVGIVIIVGIV